MIKFTLKLFFVYCLINSTTYAQLIEPKGSFSVDIGIPTAERNIAFNKVLEGLFNGGIGYQYNIYKGLSVGGGAKYSFFVNDRFALNKTVGKGGLHIPAVYAKIGYEKFTTDRFSFNFGVRLGYANMISINDSTKVNLGKPYEKTTFFVEPQLELLLTTESNEPSGFSLVLGYNFYFAEYNTEFLAREQFIGFSPEWSNGITRFFSLGFGYRYYFDLY
ncbi:MAG TPA: hypothetical protein EYG85_10035 [Crocinitomix sp.]|nr:hypothetical protein [Crocinitomix sp.]